MLLYNIREGKKGIRVNTVAVHGETLLLALCKRPAVRLGWRRTTVIHNLYKHFDTDFI